MYIPYPEYRKHRCIGMTTGTYFSQEKEARCARCLSDNVTLYFNIKTNILEFIVCQRCKNVCDTPLSLSQDSDIQIIETKLY